MGEKQFLIRPAEEKDSSEIAELVGLLGYSPDLEAIKRRVQRISKSPVDLLIVAINPEHEVVGWLQAHSAAILESGFRVEIVGMVVSPRNRRMGIGRVLVDEAVNWAKRIQAESIVVRSNINRRESHHFYAALGFTNAKTQHVYRRRS